MSEYRAVLADERYYEANVPCQAACPVQTACGLYAQAVADGRDELAFELARAGNPFVHVLGRVCSHPCETACRRGLIDEPVALCALKRFATERQTGRPPSAAPAPRAPRTERVAIVGAGPLGLTAAYDLALLGYSVELFEAAPVPGGMLYLGIPHYRLPRELIKMEVDRILATGVRLHTRTFLGRDVSLKDLRARFDAVLIATGLSRGRDLGLPGLHLDGVLQGVDFLINANLGYRLDLGQHVVVVGGGNIAVDVARSALRLLQEPALGEAILGAPDGPRADGPRGAKHGYMPALDVARLALRAGALSVQMVSLESRETMVAFKDDLREAEAEGVRIENGWMPVEILGDRGRVRGIRFVRQPGQEPSSAAEAARDRSLTLECESVILAVGQEADLRFLSAADGIRVTPSGWIDVTDDLETTADGVFAAGDVACGARVLVDVVAQGHIAARAIHRRFGGSTEATGHRARFRRLPSVSPAPHALEVPRQPLPMLSLNRRIGISEVSLGYDELQARKEAGRCLRCDVNTVFDGSKCILCGGCVEICPENCLRLVDLADVRGGERLERLVNGRFGAAGAELPRRRAAAIIKDESRCTRCALCAMRCPAGAITMERFEQGPAETRR